MKLIRITEEHIFRGSRMNANSCPVALAIQKAYGTNYVYASTVGISIHGIKGKINVGRRAKNFMNAFDWNKAVKPTTFILFERLKWLI